MKIEDRTTPLRAGGGGGSSASGAEDHLEALLLLASGLCHDVNNALGAALGFVEIAREETPPPSEAHQDLGAAVDALARAIGLIGQFRTLCQPPSPHRAGVPLTPLLKEFGKRLGCGQRGRGGRWMDLPQEGLLAQAELLGLYQALCLLFPGWPDSGEHWEWGLRLVRGRPPLGESDGQDRDWALFQLSCPRSGTWDQASWARLSQAWQGLGGGAAIQAPGQVTAWLPLAGSGA